MPDLYRQLNCDSCTLAHVMRDCVGCAFARGLTAPHATRADVAAMYKRLWYPYTPKGVKMLEQMSAPNGMEGGELLDKCEGLHVGQLRVCWVAR